MLSLSYLFPWPKRIAIRKVELAMRKLVLAAVAAGMFALVAQAEGTAKTLADVGSTGIAGEPNVALIDRGAINPDYAGTYALVFSNAQATTFTFNSPWAVKEFLVVGGGGAGGGNVGAGGGGGGVIYFTESLLAKDAAADNVQTNFENGQSISLTVGAGGTGGFKETGKAGGRSTLTLGKKTYVAFGGGGGGNYHDKGYYAGDDNDKKSMPGEGGTGCGAGIYNGGGDTGRLTTMKGEGYYGHNGGVSRNNSYTGGGGGAGGVGGDNASNMGGKGGDGLPCSITGAEVYYAAGGGGGDNKFETDKDYEAGKLKYALKDKAAGGLGGGGHAALDMRRLNLVAPDHAHATGYGCGGGGGCGGSGATCVGGNGSAGIVVLLIEPVEIVAEKPIVSVLVPEQGANYAKFSVSVVADGLDNTTASEVWGGWAKEGEEITCTKLADAVAVNGSVAKTVTGLEVGAIYAYKFYAVNENSVEGDAVTGTITLEKGDVDPESDDPVVTSGACTVNGTSVNVPYCVAWPGEGKETCSVTLKYGLMADKLSYSVDLGSGLIGNNSTQVTGFIPGRKYFFQLTADNEEKQASSEVFTATIADGETFPTEFNENQPVIAGIGGVENFVLGGEGVLYSGAFANYVDGTTVTFHYSKDNEVWATSVAAVTSEGFKVAVESGLDLLTDYSYYFTAVAGDFADCTQVKVFNTKGPARVAGTGDDVAVQKTNLRILGVECNVTDVGAGTNTVLCLMAKVNNEWIEVSSMPVDHTGLFTIWTTVEQASMFDYGTSYGVKVAIKNTTFGGTTWPNPSTTAEKSYTREDATTYTWNGGDGLWNVAENWKPNSNPLAEGAAGYPVYGSTANFAKDAVATVRVDRAESIRTMDVSNVKYLRLLGVSENAEVRLAAGDARSLKGVDTHFILDGVVMNAPSATMQLNADKATVSGSHTYLEFAGSRAALTLPKGLYFDDTVQRGAATLTFNVPRDGYAATPVQIGTKVFPSEGNNGNKVTIAIDPSSRFFWRSKEGSQLLISNPKGIYTGDVEFAETFKGRGTFRYAWPNEDPNHEGNPTELWLDVTANPGMMIIFGGL